MLSRAEDMAFLRWCGSGTVTILCEKFEKTAISLGSFSYERLLHGDSKLTPMFFGFLFLPFFQILPCPMRADLAIAQKSEILARDICLKTLD